MKYILRIFGLIRLKDVNTLLEKESEYWKNKRNTLSNTDDILQENYTNLLSNYAQCCKDLKSSFYLLNKWW